MVETVGILLIIVGRSGMNVGKVDLQVWEKVTTPSKEDKEQRGFCEALGLLCLLSALFVLENIMVRISEYLWSPSEVISV